MEARCFKHFLGAAKHLFSYLKGTYIKFLKQKNFGKPQIERVILLDFK